MAARSQASRWVTISLGAELIAYNVPVVSKPHPKSSDKGLHVWPTSALCSAPFSWQLLLFSSPWPLSLVIEECEL